jgi:DNA-binding transcriptional ArsR family regulator
MRNRTVTDPDIFHAIADPTRRALLDLLRNGGQTPGRIAAAFPVSRAAVSKQLRLLHRAHLVREHRQGRHRYYQLNPEPMKAVDRWLDHYRVFWTGKLSSLKSHVEEDYANVDRVLRINKRERSKK